VRTGLEHGRVPSGEPLIHDLVIRAATERRHGAAIEVRVVACEVVLARQVSLLAADAKTAASLRRSMRSEAARTAPRAGLAGRGNVHVVAGDGSEGLPEQASFDAFLVAAAHLRVPEPLADQLAESGRLVQPLGFGGAEDVVLVDKRGGKLQRVHSVSSAHFVRPHGRHGLP
jgi:protein-L-isoaspartate(D-aspartate) O-methyltransferase